MPTYPLSEAITAGQAGHAAIHNEERDAINDLWDRHGRSTGWRIIGGPGITVGGYPSMPLLRCAVRRIGSVVEVRTTQDGPAVAYSSYIVLTSDLSGAVLPVGMRPGADPGGMGSFLGGVVYDESGRAVAGAGIYAEANGTLTLTAVSGKRHYGHLIFSTPDAYPTTLPGVTG